jgi:hypothetical protein
VIWPAASWPSRTSQSIALVAADLTLLVLATGVMLALSPLLSPVIGGFIPRFVVLAICFRDRSLPASWNDQRLAGSVAAVVEDRSRARAGAEACPPKA